MHVHLTMRQVKALGIVAQAKRPGQTGPAMLTKTRTNTLNANVVPRCPPLAMDCEVA
jgi:hypothetical protein